MNRKKHESSLLEVFSDAGSTPAASTIKIPNKNSAFSKGLQFCADFVLRNFRTQRDHRHLEPVGVEALQGAVSTPASREKPSHYLVVTEDKMISAAGTESDGPESESSCDRST
jgi:hypothetical protein